MAGFVHLRLHSEFSLRDSVVRIKPLMSAISERHMGAVAITDQNNLFAIVKAYKAAHRKGIKIIIGVDLSLVSDEEQGHSYSLTLLCTSLLGYRNLSALITRAYIEGQHRGEPRIHRDWLSAGSCEDLIALSGGYSGELAQLVGNESAFEQSLRRWQQCFGDRFYIEVSRAGREGEEDYLHAIVPLAAKYAIPLVATNDVRFLDQSDFEAHEARVCIHDGYQLGDAKRPRRYTRQQSLTTPDEMLELFGDLPEALQNTVEVAKRCNLKLELGHSVLPEFPVPPDETVESHLRKQSYNGLEKRIGEHPDIPLPEYHQRLDRELGVILDMGFPGYFLIVADFCRWSRENGVPVGPGRGSGAGSLVAYCLGITDLDPLQYDLLFERFLNPERVSMPDFDIDFCMEGRDKVIDYVATQYGRDHVSQIITYGTMAARAVVRDVGRVLGHNYGFVDRIAKLIPFEIGMTLDVALKQDAEFKKLYAEDDEVRTLIDLARRLEGLARNAGKHAGGVVIAPSKLTDFTPLYCEDGGVNVVTQLDKDDVEAVGLVKFDFLGLRTLTILDWATDTINEIRAQAGEQALDMSRIPMDDPATFELLKRCATTAVFQLESSGMKDLIKRLQPDRFEDIIALVALFRPGPLQSGMVDDFIKRKHGEEIVAYPHPALEEILEPTYGVILYQEQVMQIAQVLANYSLGAADLLRRAMGKKKPEEMAKQRDIFVNGALEQLVEKNKAEYIFDLMEKFAGYGFNKSHSAAYALLAYHTAWQKAHYPAAFMAAVLSADMDNTDKILTLIEDCYDMKLDVLVPDINHGDYRFTVADDSRINYGLGAIKGVGKAAVLSMIAERAENGAFTSLDEFCQRIDLGAVNRRVLEALVKAGALDKLGDNRATHLANLPEALKAAEQRAQASAAGQDDLFGDLAANDASASDITARRYTVLPELEELLRLKAEKEALGLWLTGHPIDTYRKELDALVGGPLAQILGPPAPSGQQFGRGKKVIIGGLIGEMRRRGNRMSFKLEDRSTRVEVVVFDDVHDRYRHLLVAENVILVEGTLRYDEFLNGWSVRVSHIQEINQARQAFASHLVILWHHDRANDAQNPNQSDLEARAVDQLRDTLTPFRQGDCQVSMEYRGARAAVRLTFGDEWRVTPTTELLEQLNALVGEKCVKVVYPPGVARSDSFGHKGVTRIH